MDTLVEEETGGRWGGKCILPSLTRRGNGKIQPKSGPLAPRADHSEAPSLLREGAGDRLTAGSLTPRAESHCVPRPDSLSPHGDSLRLGTFTVLCRKTGAVAEGVTHGGRSHLVAVSVVDDHRPGHSELGAIPGGSSQTPARSAGGVRSSRRCGLPRSPAGFCCSGSRSAHRCRGAGCRVD